MTRLRTRCLLAAFACALAASWSPARAQGTAVLALPAPPGAAAVEGGGAKHFVLDVGGDYKHFFSKENAWWLGVGGVMALTVHAADIGLSEQTEADAGSMHGGKEYGGPAVQFPLALGWWIAGSAAGNSEAADTGRDLLRAQISATSWTYVLKYAANRTRPNGDPRSFPSGHSSAVFATAMVLQQHYGWKLGVPSFAAAAYTATSRVVDRKHWASDVVFGAVLGMVSARTVTVRLRQTTFSFAPSVVPGGGGVLVSASRNGS